MQISPSAIQKVDMTAANTARPINIYMGWEIFLSRIFKERVDKGLWLHWHHPADQNCKRALRYGYFIAPDQTLEEALHAVYQSIEAIVELESMESHWSATPVDQHLECSWEALPVGA